MDMEEIYKAIGRKIRQKRKAKKWTQEKFGELVGILPEYVSRIERGIGHPSLELLYSMAEVLECPIFDLMPSTTNPAHGFFSHELEYQLNSCSQWKRQRIASYLEWELQQPDP